MEKDIKDYAYLYIGCPAMAVDRIDIGKLRGIVDDKCALGFGRNYRAVISLNFNQVTLILRPLSDITEKEARIIIDELPMYLGHESALDHHFIQALINDMKYVYNYKDSFEIVRLLLKFGFDIFNLHESNLCLYRNGEGGLY